MDWDAYLAKPDKTIKEHTEELLAELDRLKELGYIKDEEIYKLTREACKYHDCGKVTQEFQKRIRNKNLKFDERKEVAHNILSIYFVNPKSFDDKKDYYCVVHGILFHHDYCDPYIVLRDAQKLELIKELLKNFEECYPIKLSLKNYLAEIVSDPKAVQIKGLLHKCDYSASGGYVSEYPNDFLEEGLEKSLKNFQKTDSDPEWNDLQKFCIAHKNENIIGIAQTGMGKTEAGLLWIGNWKGFFVLPLRTAINAIYDRIKKDILFEDQVDRRLAILHSNALEAYLKREAHDHIGNILEYQSRGKHLSIPLNISIMDQLFDFVFKYQGYELKLTTLAYSKIVIDEIQMYDPELLAYLILGLEKIVHAGGKVAILTATLAPFIREKLEKKIPFVRGTFYDDSLKRHHLSVRNKKINSEDIYSQFTENKKEGSSSKILVVCNTIKKAQEIYVELKKLFKENSKDCQINLLHSRFICRERFEKEKMILAFGKTYNELKTIDVQEGIWISTSLVEASLDIDFDYLFTELQDLNSLFQRLGRCNRKGVKSVEKPNCFIYLMIDEGTLKIGDKGFIDKTIYEVSKEALVSFSGILSEKQKIEMIEKNLTTEKLSGSNYLREYEEAYCFIKGIKPYKFENKEEKLRNILSEDIIPSPIFKLYEDELRGYEKKIQNKSISVIEKIQIKEKIKDLTVSVPLYEVHRYESARIKGEAEEFDPIVLNQFEKIKIIECFYGELGFQRMEYKKVVREANIL